MIFGLLMVFLYCFVMWLVFFKLKPAEPAGAGAAGDKP